MTGIAVAELLGLTQSAMNRAVLVEKWRPWAENFPSMSAEMHKIIGVPLSLCIDEIASLLFYQRKLPRVLKQLLPNAVAETIHGPAQSVA
jgi:hypothetical protein